MKQATAVGLLGFLMGWCPLYGLARDGEFGPAFVHSVPLTQSGSGGLTLNVDLGGARGEFLLDTGASLVTINRELFEEVRAGGGVEPAGRVAARLASGKLEMLEVYRIARFTLGENCELGPLKVAVHMRGGRNLLGLSALVETAPFAVFTAPPALGLSRCGEPAFAAR